MQIRRLNRLVLLLAAFAAHSGAQAANHAQKPAVGVSAGTGSAVASIEKRIPKLNEFHPQQPKRIVLSNGMIIFLQEDRELPLIDGSILIRLSPKTPDDPLDDDRLIPL